jgi:hypothetical protein
MNKVDMNKIYTLMTRRYGVKSFNVDTFIELKHLKLSKNIKLTFTVEKDIEIDYPLLQRRLTKCIASSSFYILVDEDRITVFVECYPSRSQIDYDFEFSKN